MNYGSMLGNSFDYTRDGLLGNWGKWLLLFICMVIFPLWGGYQWKIYKGESRMPPLDDWVGMFINGIKLLVVGIVYFIIPTIVFMVVGGAGILMGGAAKSSGAGALIGMLVGMIFLFIFSLIAIMGLVRFARTDSFGEAFNFSAIIAHIGEIGWVSYILALIIFWIVVTVAAFVFSIAVGIISLILALIPLIGWLLAFLLNIIIALLIGPFVGVFGTRYITQIYDSARAPA
ncbi:MAG: DUF4013 domain-containing protein [Methanoculleus sp.]